MPAEPAVTTTPTPRTAPPRLDKMPPWKVLLHNDDVNDMLHVVESIVMLGLANRHVAMLRMLEAHSKGLTLLIVTHRERAELLQEQLGSRKLTVTIEPE